MDEKSLKEASAQKLQLLRQKPLISEILNKLKYELPANLHYHTAAHTDDVLQEALIYGMHDNLKERDLELLAVAAAYHDAGFLVGRGDTEIRASEMVRSAMYKADSYSTAEIELVYQMILDTQLIREAEQLRQIPHTELSKYLLDADLSNFGREDFLDKLELVHKEVGVERKPFLVDTLQLMLGHEWYSTAAKKLRARKKKQNLAKLKTIVAAIK